MLMGRLPRRGAVALRRDKWAVCAPCHTATARSHRAAEDVAWRWAASWGFQTVKIHALSFQDIRCVSCRVCVFGWYALRKYKT